MGSIGGICTVCYSVSTTEYVSIFSRLSAQCSSSIVHKIHALLSPYMCRLVSDVICSPCHQLIATIHTCEQDLWHATRAFILKVHTPADDRQKKLNVKKPIQPCKKPQKQNSRKVRIGGRNLNTVKRIDKSVSGDSKKGRCGECEGCRIARGHTCGECKYCLDLRKFGGPHRLKKPCVQRQCVQWPKSEPKQVVTLPSGQNLTIQRKKSRCGSCPGCTVDECGKCKYCLDRVKFGGTGTLRQTCVQRACTNMQSTLIQDADNFTEDETLSTPDDMAHFPDLTSKNSGEKNSEPTSTEANSATTPKATSRRRKKCAPIPCPHCPRVFSAPSSYSSHLNTHTGARPYQCHTCGKSFSLAQTLRNHKNLKHTDRCQLNTYICETCGKTFNNKSNLNLHTKVHQEKTYQCEVCPKKFTQKGNLKAHMRQHEGEKPYMCHHCGQTFTHRPSYKNHMTKHPEESAQYKCEVCAQQFNYSRHLEDHMRLHSGEKPHECSVCGKRFRLSGPIKKHMMTHTGEKPHACQLCGYRTITGNSLRRHMRTHGDAKLKKQKVSDVVSRKDGESAKVVSEGVGEPARWEVSLPLPSIIDNSATANVYFLSQPHPYTLPR